MKEDLVFAGLEISGKYNQREELIRDVAKMYECNISNIGIKMILKRIESLKLESHMFLMPINNDFQELLKLYRLLCLCKGGSLKISGEVVTPIGKYLKNQVVEEEISISGDAMPYDKNYDDVSHIFEFSSSDWLWNVVRNHILTHMKRINEICPEYAQDFIGNFKVENICDAIDKIEDELKKESMERKMLEGKKHICDAEKGFLASLLIDTIEAEVEESKKWRDRKLRCFCYDLMSLFSHEFNESVRVYEDCIGIHIGNDVAKTKSEKIRDWIKAYCKVPQKE